MTINVSDIEDLPEYTDADGIDWFLVVVDENVYKVSRDTLLDGFVPESRIVATGEGLVGGGNLSADRLLYIPTGGISYELLANSGVTPQTVGDATHIPVLTVDDKGRVTAITTATPSVSGYVPLTTSVVGAVGIQGGGTLNANRTFTLVSSITNPLPLGTVSAGTSGIAAHEDHVHPALDLSSTTELRNVLQPVAGGTGRSMHVDSTNYGAVLYSAPGGFQMTEVSGTGTTLRRNLDDNSVYWGDGGGGGGGATLTFGSGLESGSYDGETDETISIDSTFVATVDGTQTLTNKTLSSPTITGTITGNPLLNGSLNKLTITAPATNATLTLANNSSFITSGSNSLELTTTGNTSLTLPIAGELLSNSELAINQLVGTDEFNKLVPYDLVEGDNVTISQSGTSITISASGGGGGVTTIGDIDSETASSNGAVIDGSDLYMQSASATAPGLVNTTTQTFAGLKTFNAGVTLGSVRITPTTSGGNPAVSFNSYNIVGLFSLASQTIDVTNLNCLNFTSQNGAIFNNNVVVNGKVTANNFNLTTASENKLIGTSGTSKDLVSYDLIGGDNVTISKSGASFTISANSGDSFVWNNITSTTQTISPDNGYVTHSATQTVFTLPSTAAFGTKFSIVYLASSAGQLLQNAGQIIIAGDTQTTIGTDGRIENINLGEVLTILCTAANTEFTVISPVGNFDVV
jgi:hypothetical protein